MSKTRLITPPVPAVTLAEAKSHLNVFHDDDDALIQGYAAAAQARFDGPDGILGIALEAQTLEMALDAFPAAEILLPFGPAVSVVSVAYTDADGATQTVPPEDYTLDTYSAEPWIVPYAAWPATMDTINAVRVRWIAGTGCPEPIRHAIKLMVAHFYGNREAAGPKLEELPLGVYPLVMPYRQVFV